MKSRTSLLTVVLASTTLFSVSSPAQNNTLAPGEIEDGWILLFDGETQFGWSPRGDARWDVADGAISYRAGTGPGFLSTTTEFADYVLKLEFWIDNIANSGVFLRCPATGEINPGNAYEANIYDAHDKWPTGSLNEVARTKLTPKTTGKWNTFEITLLGNHLLVRLNGQVATEVHNSKISGGTIALQNFKGTGRVRFRNIKLKPLGLKPIFNGKDLAGWNILPDRKSVYSVTPEGWLNVKNGNGDLQSEAEFGDFIFQLDIISNGTHLNSGVFFRAIPGQFWSGYESQIRNQWQENDRTKPVDFGTGGLYNRQPARRVVSSDRQWFSKTILAQGPHLATWVNGIQVTDWIDTRPPNESARRGYRAKPGVLSLQGHDPTTDLSFRDLRIAELPPPRK